MAKVVETKRFPIMAIVTIGQSLSYFPRSKAAIMKKATPPQPMQIMYGHLLPVLISRNMARVLAGKSRALEGKKSQISLIT